MRKVIKSFALILVVAIAAACMSIFAAACGNKETVFTITVQYSDGTAVDGTKDPLNVQICNADSSFCYAEQPTVDANGQVTFEIEKVDAAAAALGLTNVTYVIHVLDRNADIPTQLDLVEEVTVDSSNTTATVKLAERTAP